MQQALGLAFEVSKSMNCAEGKNVPRGLLGAECNFIDNETNIVPSSR